MNRTANVIRLQLVNTQTYVWVPLLVLGGAFVITLGIYAILAGAGVTTAMYGGGAQAPLWYFAIVGIQALTLTFPFSQALSVTRREFFFGTLATAAITAAMLAVIFVIGGFLEEITGGWGMNGYFFALDWVWDAGPAVAGAFYFTLAMLFFIIGFGGATLYKRFGALWLTVVLLALAALLLIALWIIARANAWAQVFTWFAELGAGGLVLLMVAVSVVVAAGSFLTLRRTIP